MAPLIHLPPIVRHLRSLSHLMALMVIEARITQQPKASTLITLVSRQRIKGDVTVVADCILSAAEEPALVFGDAAEEAGANGWVRAGIGVWFLQGHVEKLSWC